MSVDTIRDKLLGTIQDRSARLTFPEKSNLKEIARQGADRNNHDAAAIQILQNIFAKNDFSKQQRIKELLDIILSYKANTSQTITLTSQQAYLFAEIFGISPARTQDQTDLYVISKSNLDAVNKIFSQNVLTQRINIPNGIGGMAVTAPSDKQLQDIQAKQYTELQKQNPTLVASPFNDLDSLLGDKTQTVAQIQEKISEKIKDNNHQQYTLYQYHRLLELNKHLDTVLDKSATLQGILPELTTQDFEIKKDLEELGLDSSDTIKIENYPVLNAAHPTFHFFSHIDSLLEDIVIFKEDETDKDPVIDQSSYLRLAKEKIFLAILAKEAYENTLLTKDQIKELRKEIIEIDYQEPNALDILVTEYGISEEIKNNIKAKIDQQKKILEQARDEAAKSPKHWWRRAKIDHELVRATKTIINSYNGDYLINAYKSLEKGSIVDYINNMEIAISQSFSDESEINQARALFLYGFIDKLSPEQKNSILTSDADSQFRAVVRQNYNWFTSHGEIFINADRERFIAQVKKRLEADATQLEKARRKSPQPLILKSTSQKIDTDQICADFGFYHAMDYLTRELHKKLSSSEYSHLGKTIDQTHYHRIEDLLKHYKENCEANPKYKADNNLKILIEITRFIEYTKHTDQKYLVEALEFLDKPYKGEIPSKIQATLKNLFDIPSTNYQLESKDIDAIKERIEGYDLSALFKITELQAYDDFYEIESDVSIETLDLEKANRVGRRLKINLQISDQDHQKDIAINHLVQLVKIGMAYSGKDSIISLLKEFTKIQENAAHDGSDNSKILDDCKIYYQSVLDVVSETNKAKLQTHYDAYITFLKGALTKDSSGAIPNQAQKDIRDLRQIAAGAIYEINEAEIDVAFHALSKIIKYNGLDKDNSIFQEAIKEKNKLHHEILALKNNFNKSRKNATSLSNFVSSAEELSQRIIAIKTRLEDDLLPLEEVLEDKKSYKERLEIELQGDDLQLKERLNKEIQLVLLEQEPYASKEHISKDDKRLLEMTANSTLRYDLEFTFHEGLGEDVDLDEEILNLIANATKPSDNPVIDQKEEFEDNVSNLIMCYCDKIYKKAMLLGEALEEDSLEAIYQKYANENKSHEFFKAIKRIVNQGNPFRVVEVRFESDQIQNALNEKVSGDIEKIVAAYYKKTQELVAQDKAAQKVLRYPDSEEAIYDDFLNKLYEQGKLGSFIQAIREIESKRRGDGTIDLGDTGEDKINDIENIINHIYKESKNPEQKIQQAKEIIISPLKLLARRNLRDGQSPRNIHNIFSNKRFGNHEGAKAGIDNLFKRANEYYVAVEPSLNSVREETKKWNRDVKERLEFFTKFATTATTDYKGKTISVEKGDVIKGIYNLFQLASGIETFGIVCSISPNLEYKDANDFVEKTLLSSDPKEETINIRIAKRNFDKLTDYEQLSIYKSYLISQYLRAKDLASNEIKENDTNQAVEYLMIAKLIEEEFGISKTASGAYTFTQITEDESGIVNKEKIQQKLHKLIDLRNILLGKGGSDDIEILDFVNSADTLPEWYEGLSFKNDGEEIRELYHKTLEDQNYVNIRAITGQLAKSNKYPELSQLVTYREQYDKKISQILKEIGDNPSEFQENQQRIVTYVLYRSITDSIDQGLIENLDKLQSGAHTLKNTISDLREMQSDLRNVEDLLKQNSQISLRAIVKGEKIHGKKLSPTITRAVINSYFNPLKRESDQYSAYPKELRDVLYKGQNIARLRSANRRIDNINVNEFYDPKRHESGPSSILDIASSLETQIIIPTRYLDEKEDISKDLNALKVFIKMAIALNMENEVKIINENFPQRQGFISEYNKQKILEAVEAVFDRYNEYSISSQIDANKSKFFYDVDSDMIKSLQEEFTRDGNHDFILDILTESEKTTPKKFVVTQQSLSIASNAIDLSYISRIDALNQKGLATTKDLYSPQHTAKLQSRKDALEQAKRGKSEYSRDDTDLEMMSRELNDAYTKSGGALGALQPNSLSPNRKNYRDIKSQYKEKVKQRIDEIDQKIKRG
ncbi:MAG: hypothetical protein ISQ34_05280, partial [Rickettsiales bacterium]|nr:hypothetical protein [Rickettsiales bacterium]